MQKKLVIFDFDGVLVDTLEACFSIASSVNENLSLDEYRTFFEGNIYEAKRLDGGEPRKYIPEFFERYDTATRRLVIPSPLKDLVKKFAGEYALAIVSSTPTDLIRNILARENLADCFKEILGSDIHNSKVIKIKMLLDQYSIAPVETIFITDTLGDIREGEKCGVRSIAVVWGFHERERLERGNPVAIVENASELQSAIEKALS